MTQKTFQGNPLKLAISAPEVGTKAPYFALTRRDFSEVSLDDFGQKSKVLNVFLSVDTKVCAKSVHEFLKQASKRPNVAVLNISFDLPTAFQRFCAAEGIENEVETLSCFRSHFAEDYGIFIVDGTMRGLCARAVFVLDGENRIIHRDIVDEVTNEPDYAAAMQHLP